MRSDSLSAGEPRYKRSIRGIPTGDAFTHCPNCDHPMMLHDGDGNDEHFACCRDDCGCAWEWDHTPRAGVLRHPGDPKPGGPSLVDGPFIPGVDDEAYT